MPKTYFTLAAAAAYQACSQSMFWNGVPLAKLFTTFHLITWYSDENVPSDSSFSVPVPKKKKSCKLLSWKQSTNTCGVQERKRAGPVRNSKGGLSPVLQIRSSLPAPSPPSSISVPIGNQVVIAVCFTGGGWVKPKRSWREVPSVLNCQSETRSWLHFSFL